MSYQKQNEAVVTTVYPIVNGNGSNYITMNLAFAAKEKNPNARIAVVDLDMNNPFLGHALSSDQFHGIDNLTDKINGGFLDDSMFLENMIELKEDIHLLKGTRMGHFKNIIRIEHVKEIYSYLIRLYDYVFVATNASATDGGTPLSLYYADNILIVARLNETNKIRASKTVNNIKAMAGSGDVGVVYNMYTDKTDVSITNELGQYNVLGTIPYLVDTIDNVNLAERGLIKIKKKNETDDVYNNILEAFHI